MLEPIVYIHQDTTSKRCLSPQMPPSVPISSFRRKPLDEWGYGITSFSAGRKLSGNQVEALPAALNDMCFNWISY